MKEFEKTYEKGRFTKSDIEYNYSLKEKDENSIQDELDSMEKNIDGLNKTEAKENNEKFEKNSGEILKNLPIVNLDSKNNRDTKIFNIKKDNKKLKSKSKHATSQTSGKRKGRKKKEKAGTGKHSANDKDNQRDKEMTKGLSESFKNAVFMKRKHVEDVPYILGYTGFRPEVISQGYFDIFYSKNNQYFFKRK